MRDFNDLDETTKVKAVLATVREPVSKEMLLDFAGVDLSLVDDKKKREIQDMISSAKAVSSEGQTGTERYWVPLEQQQQTLEELGVEWKTVHGRIADVLMKDLGFGPNPDKKG